MASSRFNFLYGTHLVTKMAEGGSKNKQPLDIIAEIGVDDLYQFLGIDFQCSEKEIKGAYRKKALKCHPDKNLDDPHASELFQRLSKAYQILIDPAAKAAYDKWLKAKHAAKRRHDELNVKRRKLKETLEMREVQSYHTTIDEKIAAKAMQKEIDRLREEGFRKIKEQEELLRQQLQRNNNNDDEDVMPTLRVNWKAKKTDGFNGGYSQKILEDIFSEIGGVHHILMSRKKKGKAIVSFLTAADAMLALESGCGLEDNPLHLAWASGDPSVSGAENTKRKLELQTQPRNLQNPLERTLEEDRDYESLTLMRLKQAQEKKRIVEQLKKKDESKHS